MIRAGRQSATIFQRLVRHCQRSHRSARAGGPPAARAWFAYEGSMTQQLRVMGTLTVQVEWFQTRMVCSGSSVSVWKVRHAILSTPNIGIEAWVWLPQSACFLERQWFQSMHQPVGDVLFRRTQRRRFRFFTLPGDTRTFRYSRLVSPKGTFIYLIEGWEPPMFVALS